MSNAGKASVYDPKALETAKLLTRDAYKALKHMDKVQLTGYIGLVWRNGYQAGLSDAKKQAAAEDQENQE